MRLILNVLWVVCGGWLTALLWAVAGVLMAISIIGLPWARAAFNFALFALWPFGREAISRKDYYGKADFGTGTLGLIGNIVWAILFGILIAISHVGAAVLSAITIIGIPFAIPHLKLAGMALAPVGKMIVSKEEAEEVRRRMAAARLDAARVPA